jgi:hypothetical protein
MDKIGAKTMRKKIFAATILLLLSFCYASITNYSVTPQVNLGNEAIITGKYFNILKTANVICSHYAIDSNTGQFIYRASDSTTDPTGFFYQKIKINEPKFKRGNDYNIMTKCGLDDATMQFTVVQRETVYNPLLWEFKWLTSGGNLNPVLWLALLGIIIIGGFFGTFWLFKRYTRRF